MESFTTRLHPTTKHICKNWRPTMVWNYVQKNVNDTHNIFIKKIEENKIEQLSKIKKLDLYEEKNPEKFAMTHASFENRLVKFFVDRVNVKKGNIEIYTSF